MSRVGSNPVSIPSGVTVNIDGKKVTAKGKLGELSLDIVDDVDVVMITDMKEPQKIFDGLIKIVTLDRLLLPGFLHISRVRPQLMEE